MVPFVNMGNKISGYLLALRITSSLSIGSPPAKTMKLIPISFACMNMSSHSSSVSWFTGSVSAHASFALE